MIDRGITYDDLKGLEKILRIKGTNNRTAAKPNKPRPKPTYINGNVIDLHPYLTDEFWKIKTETDDETDDDSSKRKIKKAIKRYASYEPEIDDPIMALEYWHERWLAHPYRNRFKTLKDFISYSMSEEDQPFHKGGSVNKKKSGLASLAESAVASDLLKKVISGKVALQFSTPHIQRSLK
jgi:hypothetical protein|tara:strand:+ start:495 stop:1034 length:540 start_codon:yes stop_codon:yes gene_type:complete